MTDTSGLWQTGYALVASSAVLQTTKVVQDEYLNTKKKSKGGCKIKRKWI